MTATRNDDWMTNDELRDLARFALPTTLRVARAVSYAFTSYLLLYLQPHFAFSFAGFSFAIFCLAIVRRGLLLAEAALLLLVLSVFVPPGFLQWLADMA